VTAENIAAFIDENLSQARFTDYLADPDRAVLAARDDSRIVGYAMLIRGVPDDSDVQQAVTLRPGVELSKMYVLPDCHGAGVSAALMTAALSQATDFAAKSVWLGVNQRNQRAQRFYAKHGFTINGTKTFRLGASVENDYVMVRPL
jgi:ribosomal protein S18 acetylase RimI-like enzyme